MEILKLEEKASVYSRKIKPARVYKFACVKYTPAYSKNEEADEYNFKNYYEKKKSKIGSLLVILLMTMLMSFLACFFLIEHNQTINTQLIKVIEKVFSPKDFGKIKFVDTNASDYEKEAFGFMQGLIIPFNSCVSTCIGETFLLQSPSEITIKCAMDGVVEDIKTDKKTLKKSIIVKHKYDIKTEYYLVDTCAVKVGDSVFKNSILGLTLSGDLGFKITYKNSIVKGLEIIDGELGFC